MHTPEEAIAFYERWVHSYEEELDAAADGVVVKVNGLDYQERLGVVGREPRWAVAYKFPAVQEKTRLKKIKVNVGRTGSLNPYAVLKPVNIAGATVKQATLHNEDYIRARDLMEGDWVVVERAGEVIPQVVSVIANSRTGAETRFEMPEFCPKCSAPVVIPEDDAMSYCVNTSCPAQLVRLLEHFVSRGAMDIEGMGIKWGEYLIQQGLIKDVADIYSLNEDSLAQLNLLDVIESAKKRPFADALASSGIRTVGKKSAGIIADYFDNMSDLSCADELKGERLEGVSARTARAMFEHFSGLRSSRDFTNRGSYFLENGLIDVQSDLFYVNRKHLLDPESLRQKSVSNLLRAIKESKRRPLSRVLVALGIGHVGSEVAELLAREFTTIDNLIRADVASLKAIDTIDESIAESVVSYFRNEANLKVIDKLKKAGVRLEDEGRVVPTEQPFVGMRFVVTGRLERFSRSQVQDLIKQYGGAVSGSVSKNTNYLVAGEGGGSKLADAQRLEVEVLTEDELLVMLPPTATQN